MYFKKPLKKSKKQHSSGFTLLELLISVGLLAIMGLITAQTLKNTNRRSAKITSGLDGVNALRSAFKLIERDIAAGFNHRDINIFLYNQAQTERVARYDDRQKEYVEKKNKEGANPQLNLASLTEEQRKEMEKSIGPKPQNKPIKTERVVTHFKGEKDSLFFTSSSGTRLRESERISELIEVGYIIKDCRSRKNKKLRTKCLWRSVSHNLDGVLEEGESQTVLLENIKEFEISYLTFNSEDPEWVETWDSENVADIIMGNKFPSAVSLDLSISTQVDKSGKSNKSERLFGVFPIRFPNNDPFKNLKSSVTNNTNNPPTGGTN